MRDPLSATDGRPDPDTHDIDRSGWPSASLDGPIGIEQAARDLGDQPDSHEGDRRDELPDDVDAWIAGPAGVGRPDLLPDVEVPDEQA
ncbi:MAG: hypothetical protein HY263_07165 [Chloroflexi bacterium]|nr:hypothetical protein [Chloroflexota bacterium]